jgi:serine/threonine-protein kinase
MPLESSSDGASKDPLINAIVAGRYRIISRLGQGGMGVTYRAWDMEVSRPVVLKHPKPEMLASPGFLERFRREARMMAALNNPHVVPVTMVGEHNGIPYIVMPFLPGGSLSNRRLRDDSGEPQPMHPSTLHLWLPQVAAALDYVHSQGVVHRDVKPGNVFFDGFWHAFLGDFGISKIVEETESLDREHTLTATRVAVGTHGYMAPELFAPKPVLDGRVDQYALAVMVYEMLAGRRPFTGDTAHLIVEVTTKNVPPLRGFRRDLPRSLEEAVDQSLAKHSGDRFGSCLEFVEHALADVPPMQDEPGVARLLCPACENLLKLPTSAAGKGGRCPRCKSQMMVARDLSALWLVGEETGTKPRDSQESTADPGLDPCVWDSQTTALVAGIRSITSSINR